MTSMFVIVEASLAGEPGGSKMGSVDGYKGVHHVPKRALKEIIVEFY